MHRILLLIIVGVSLFGTSGEAEDWSDKPIIDEQFKNVELEIKESTKPCREKGKNTLQIIDCKKRMRKKYLNEGQLRGTEEYCRKHYGHRKKEELRRVWKELKQQRRKARIKPADKIPGEVTEGMFMVEEFWVESRLAKLQKERTVKTEKKVYQKSE